MRASLLRWCSRAPWLLLACGAAAQLGCVSSAAYERALFDAREARLRAERSEQATGALQSTVEALARRLDAQEATPAEMRGALDLVRSLRALGLVTPATSVNRGPRRPPQAAPVPAVSGSPTARPPGRRKPGRPLDLEDPWRRAGLAGAGAASGAGATSAIAGTPPLDAEDPWSSARKQSAPPLDPGDPW